MTTAMAVILHFGDPGEKRTIDQSDKGESVAPPNNKKMTTATAVILRFCDPGEARTLDPLIKSQLLYQLSYGVIAASSLKCAAKL